jgi:hypothetical protein
MFTLLKLGVSIVALLAFAWFGMTFKLGSRTLFEHLHAIGQSKESQELVDGTRQAVRHKISAGVADEAARAAGAPPAMGRDAGAPLERLSSSERRQLKYLLDKAAQ